MWNISEVKKDVIVLYWLWRLGVFCVSHLPREWSFRAAGWLGNTFYYLMPLRRRVARENFAHVLSKTPNDPEVGRVTRHAFQNFARLLCDVMIYPSLSIQEIERRITIRHNEYIEQALSYGKGVIFVSAHFGNMDLPSAFLAHRYAPFTLVAETLRPKELMDWLTRIRHARGVYLYPYDSAPRKIIEALKRNEMTAFLLDFGVTHHFDITTVPVRFFNTETDFPAGPAQLALLTGAPIIVGYARMLPNGCIEAEVTPPILVSRANNRHEVIQSTMQEIARRMEQFIRAYPEQWYIFRPMWKSNRSARRKIPSLSQHPHSTLEA
ncbi:MAG: lysophospholipid acyltransferase family protein [Anaerolineae bacterium]|nr:lysophospholipid acyltransferase family protein [Anaerolineae bacterium]